jgi:hypothetical protein
MVHGLQTEPESRVYDFVVDNLTSMPGRQGKEALRFSRAGMLKAYAHDLAAVCLPVTLQTLFGELGMPEVPTFPRSHHSLPATTAPRKRNRMLDGIRLDHAFQTSGHR